MKKSHLFLLVMSISPLELMANEACLSLNQGELNDLTNTVCTASSKVEVVDDKDAKKKFEKAYFDKEYQPKLNSAGAHAESRAQKNNYLLWTDVAGAQVKELSVMDKARFEALVQKTYPKNHKAKLPLILSSLNGKDNFATGYTENHLKRDLFTTLMSDPEFSKERQKISTKVASSFGKNYADEVDKKLVDKLASESLLVASLEKEDKPSPIDKNYWVSEYENTKPFKPVESQSYQLHNEAYEKYKDKLFQKAHPKITKASAKYGSDSQQVKELEKKLAKEKDSIHMMSPGKMAFTPPEGVPLDVFLAKVQAENPTFFNCRASYGPNKAGFQQGEQPDAEVEKSDPEEENENKTSDLVSESKECNLAAQFNDDDFNATDAIRSEMSGCFSNIPKDAVNVKVHIESCASTVRSTKFKGKGENFELSRQRNETLKQLVPQQYKGTDDENITQNYFGKNKLPGNPPQWTGTCGPWVTKVGEDRMSPRLCGNTNIKAVDDCNAKSPEDKFASGYNGANPYSWLCSWKDGSGYTTNQELKDELKKYRYNKLIITYDVKRSQAKPVEDSAPAVVDQRGSVPSEENKAYVLSRPHLVCLYPRLKHDKWRSAKEIREEAWNDFQSFMSSVSFTSSPSGAKPSGSKGSVACPVF